MRQLRSRGRRGARWRPRLEFLEERTLLTALTIAQENQLPGTPQSVWDVSGAGDPSIQGYADNISVNQGQTIAFKVDDSSLAAYRIDIYRMGYYGGNGARLVASIPSAQTTPQNQPAQTFDPATGLIDCGNWAVSASWVVPADATSGIYFARVTRGDTGGASHIVFVVRNDASHSQILFQTSDSTWEAYNDYGGDSLYYGNGAVGRAYAVSYNRPFNTRATHPFDWVFNAEYPMVRWLEANGYDVSYFTDVDADRNGSLIQNHGVYMDVGHDEYWSGNQRANIEGAVAAGVNLVALSGDENYWKTRWQPSTDGSGTPYRTLVCYKETWANAVIDPLDPSTWTGTWRDPRFSPPADGGRPENALTGQIFMVNNGGTASIVVPATDSALRLWRNTAVAALAPGASYTTPYGTLGYEWDADLDNGFRPAGLFDLSTTVVGNVPVLQDFGTTAAQATMVHHLTEYRAPSGALIFGAGTVQWSWGLDSRHDNGAAAPDLAMEQATVNLLADMRVQPATLQPGLAAATASTDRTPPTSIITAPAPNATVKIGGIVTITGTATDSGGGVVAGVEVSIDGGATWHPAIGTTSWTYSWVPAKLGAATILSRAVDDSANLEAPAAGVTVTVKNAPATQPFSIWAPAAVPVAASVPDPTPNELGVRFTSDVGGTITGLKFFKGALNTGTHVGHLWTSAGTLLATVTFANETAYGWQSATFSSPVTITANTVYVVSYFAPNGGYAADSFTLTASVGNAPLHAVAGGTNSTNGVYHSGSDAFPSSSFEATNYWVDVLFTASSSSTVPPSVTSAAPAADAGNVSTGATVAITFNEAIQSGTLAFTLAGPNRTLVPATISYNTSTRVATLKPTAALAADTFYTATLSAVLDSAGHRLVNPVSWSFTTASSGPVVTADSPQPFPTGVATYRAATVTFNTSIQPGTLAFTLTGPGGATVPATVNYLDSTHTATLTPNAPLAAGTTYTARVSGVKDQSGHALTVPFSWSFTTTRPAPVVTAESPLPNATGVAGATTVAATFNASIQPVTLTYTLTGPNNLMIASAVAYNDTTRVLTLTPTAALAAGTTYTATVYVSNLSGVPMASPLSWSFTTANIVSTGGVATLWSNTTTPGTPAANDSNAVELGVRFQSDVSGTITGLRFYKGTGNIGTHVGHLWTSTGTLLGSVTFTGETATGWQQMNFATPIALSANTMYVASYYAPAGHYAVDNNYFATQYDNAPLHAPAGSNGVYLYGSDGFPTNGYQASNYWVDVVFASNASGPAVTAESPAPNATGVAAATTVTATFSVAIQPSTLAFVLTGPGNATVAATVAYNSATNVATLTPAAALTAGTLYTATVSGAQGLSGVPMAAPFSWSFTTAAATGTATMLWSNATTPAIPSENDPNAVELGVRFQSDVSGTITGLRFYKGTGNTGTHVGHLWTDSGTLLGSVTFTGETATGWQQMNFATPIALSANTMYVASYYAPSGHYAVDNNYFATTYDNAPLHAPAGSNGVYLYGSDGFPTNGYQASNYWVDVVFAPSTSQSAVAAAAPATAATIVLDVPVVTTDPSTATKKSTAGA